ncbi:MAG: OmpA family protein [Erysipelothrix sp.]|nr:OmpA family protein [Erysipelothrix sp.]
MRRKKSSAPPSNEWMNTYADMVTLLLCFFILLFSMSTVDAEKWKALLRTFQNTGDSTQVVVVPGEDGDDEAGNIEDPSEFLFLKEEIEAYISNSEFAADVEIGGNEYIIFIRLNNNLLFGGDSATLRISTINFLDNLGDFIKKYEDELSQIRVNGHTATVPPRPNNYVSDRVLSTQRSNAVVMYLEDRKMIEPKKLIAMGFGKNYPIATNENEAGRSRNRRVEILILANNFEESSDINMFKILSGEFDVALYDQLLNRSVPE